MPTINKKQTTLIKRDDRKKQRQKYYQMPAWRRLSKAYMMMHPLCEMCEEKGLVTPARDIHHVLSVFDYGLSENERLNRLLAWDNLKALCRDCHNEIHGNTKKDKNNFSF